WIELLLQAHKGHGRRGQPCQVRMQTLPTSRCKVVPVLNLLTEVFYLVVVERPVGLGNGRCQLERQGSSLICARVGRATLTRWLDCERIRITGTRGAGTGEHVRLQPDVGCLKGACQCPRPVSSERLARPAQVVDDLILTTREHSRLHTVFECL